MYNRSIRFRLYPKTQDKANRLKQCLGATRFVWNYFLAENRKMMEAHRADESKPRPQTTFFALGKEFTQLRQNTHWLGELLLHRFATS